MFPHLLHKQNKNFSEDLDKVNEKVKGVGDEVLVSHPCLPDDQLGVEHDEAAEDRQAEPDVSLSHGMAFRELFLSQHSFFCFTWNRSCDLKKMLASPSHMRVESPDMRVPPR